MDGLFIVNQELLVQSFGIWLRQQVRSVLVEECPDVFSGHSCQLVRRWRRLTRRFNAREYDRVGDYLRFHRSREIRENFINDTVATARRVVRQYADANAFSPVISVLAIG